MTKFTDLKLDPKVLKAVVEAGYETPTPIQAQAIPHALEGRDVLGIAQTGTGKTASFVLPMITLLGRGRARARMPRSLVLAPTRELAAQVAENFETYAKFTKLTKALLIGGVSFGEQDKLIDRGVDVLIATPGRLLDHFERGKLLLTDVKIMVVDEADRMLDMGFIPDIERIFSLTPFTRQTFFYSATMAPEIERITNTFLSNPARVEVARQATTSETITQSLIEVPAGRKDRAFKEKRAVLRALIRAEGDACKNAIIFCNRKVDVDTLAKSLKKHGFDAAPIHGDLDQSVRTRTLEAFRDGTLRFLIASDVAARGLDIPAVSHVFNFDVPSHAEDYVHRIGRTGRAGREGRAYTIAVPSDEKYLSAIEGMLQTTLPRGPLPDGIESAPAAADDDGAREDRPRRSRARPERKTPERAASERAKPEEGAPERAPRTRTRKPREEPAAQADAPADTHADALADTPTARARPDADVPAPQPDEPAAAQAGEPAPRQQQSPRRARTEEPRRDARRDRGQGGGGGAPVVGMGDHVPDFLMREFKRPSAD